MSKGDVKGGETDAVCSCKVNRTIEKYGTDRLHEKVLQRRRDGASLRELETVVNETVLRAALRDTGTDVIGDVSTIYETLTDDDVSAGERTETVERLSGAGVDTDSLLSDFVSYQTIRTHLRDCLDIDTDRREPLSIDDAKGTVEWARSRSEGIVKRTVERLDASGSIGAGTVEVSQMIRVSCTDCGASHTVETFIDRGGCDCPE
jgi:hypothetical protein